MPGFLTRFGECVLTIVVSSIPVYMISVIGVIPVTNANYFLIFFASLIIFMILSFLHLSNYIMVVEETLPYILTNGVLFLMQFFGCVWALRVLPDVVYTAFFGFTKPFRAFGITPYNSALIFYGIYLLEIIYFPVEKAIFNLRSR